MDLERIEIAELSCMIIELILWFVFGLLSVGMLGIYFVLMKNASKKPWGLRMKKDFASKLSIIVPTYNESDIIAFKLNNLAMLDYPKELIQLIVVDSKSDDGTVEIVKGFAESHPEMRLEILVESERKGKSAALNQALKNCAGDVVIVSDADCFWPSDILRKTLPFLDDPTIGAISGPKVLLNLSGSRVAQGEGKYLDSMNLIKLGESKIGSTLLFEGGFSAFKKEILDSFDPYETGSDDCGTVISVLEKKLRAILVPEARFYTTFPTQWAEKLRMKIRRSNQLIRIYWKYLTLLVGGQIRKNGHIILADVLIYLFGPVFFALFLGMTIILFIEAPWSIIILLVFFIPLIGNFLAEIAQGFLVLFVSIWAVAFKRNFLIWRSPADRCLLTEELLVKYSLISKSIGEGMK
jgi:cellulose synthase/poly-beta-1,6-N-acetylglucosamine synthase-like glycosyltransferase